MMRIPPVSGDLIPYSVYMVNLVPATQQRGPIPDLTQDSPQQSQNQTDTLLLVIASTVGSATKIPVPTSLLKTRVLHQ